MIANTITIVREIDSQSQEETISVSTSGEGDVDLYLRTMDTARAQLAAEA